MRINARNMVIATCVFVVGMVIATCVFAVGVWGYAAWKHFNKPDVIDETTQDIQTGGDSAGATQTRQAACDYVDVVVTKWADNVIYSVRVIENGQEVSYDYSTLRLATDIAKATCGASQ